MHSTKEHRAHDTAGGRSTFFTSIDSFDKELEITSLLLIQLNLIEQWLCRIDFVTREHGAYVLQFLNSIVHFNSANGVSALYMTSLLQNIKSGMVELCDI